MLLIFGVTFIDIGLKPLTLHYPRFYVLTSTIVLSYCFISICFITQGIDLGDKL